MDAIDRGLIALLRENARAPASELARQLGLSRTTVQSRIERLERRQIIAGYTIRLTDEQERAQVRAHILITAAPKHAGKVVTALQKISEVRTLHSVSGAYDMIAVVAAASIEELDAVIDAVGALEGVERTVSSIILSTRIDR